ncbi:MAG TPA: acyl-ACP--UDP-N-acetylglucosamine O-acyltransferase [Verrucomicrobiae bacterium]|jgi:UDP-N-acetylglucosamine acyltransferase
MIHSSAIISPGAQLDPSVEVGPFSVIDGNVSLGAGCKVGPHVYLTGHTIIGPDNCFHANCVIGGAPQDVKYKDEPAGLRIGARNLFREGATVHRSAKLGEDTIVGSDNFLMVNSHLGHNVRLGSRVIVASGALLAGHVEVEDNVFISGNCLVHQFVRIGRLAIMQGGSGISQDLPPFTVARGSNNICGLNTVGLRRAGISQEERMELKRLYKKLFLSELNLSQIMEEARREFTSASSRHLLEFIAASKRGICRHRGLNFGEDSGDSD